MVYMHVELTVNVVKTSASADNRPEYFLINFFTRTTPPCQVFF